MLRFLAVLLLVICPQIAVAAPSLPMDQFGQLPILHEGRIKPLDSFARTELLKFSKKEKIENMEAISWLAATLFDPGNAPAQKIFLISNSTTRHLMELEERKKPLYSFSELTSGLEKTSALISEYMNNPDDQLTKDQKDLITLHENALEYTLILRSFSPILPLNIHVPESWKKRAGLEEGRAITFLSLQKINRDIESEMLALIKKKGSDPKAYTTTEQATAMLGWQLQTIARAGENNRLFRVIPTSDLEKWISPWEMINDGKGTPTTLQYLDRWTSLSRAWQDQNSVAWEKAIQGVDDTLSYNVTPIPSFNLWLETIYNKAAPFSLIIFIYAGAMVLACFYLAGQKGRFAYYSGVSLVIAGLIIQCIGLTARVMLLDRPPVGTLYESLLFVGMVAPLLSIVMERKLRNGIGLFVAGVSGSILGLLSLSMMGEGDNMKMLGAVLNTRFWLTTHVLCITIGYGWCLVTSVMAHLVLAARASGKPYQSLSETMMTLGLFSLLFTTVGTILGGIWADQSWGRFWGWDPKENGALLIVLWLIWMIHGKIAAQISQLVWAAGLAFLSVIVAIAWIGVNLLGVGLHSYGFIEGVFWGLGAFAIAEALFIGGLMAHIRKKEKLFHVA